MNDQIGSGKYQITCQLPAGWIITGYVLGDGSPVVTAPSPSPYLVGGLPIPGVYPVIAPAPAGS